MNWKVFKRDDPSTHPELDCKLLIYCTDGQRDWFHIAKWDKEDKHFVKDLRWLLLPKGDTFYTYLGYVPYIEKEVRVAKCGKEDGRCEYEDDGYCLCERKCNYKYESTEYQLGSKPIWKEF